MWHKSKDKGEKSLVKVRFCWHRQLREKGSENVLLLSQGTGSILPNYRGSAGYIGSLQSRDQPSSRPLLQLHLYAREYQCVEVRDHIRWGSNAGVSLLGESSLPNFHTLLFFFPFFCHQSIHSHTTLFSEPNGRVYKMIQICSPCIFRQWWRLHLLLV